MIMKPKYPVVLASASPRRVELLRRLFEEFEVLPADIDEAIDEFADESPMDVAAAIAKRKVLAIRPLRENSLIIGADTIVVIDGEIHGKPRDEEDAKAMLRRLSNRAHEVITCIFVSYGGEEESVKEVTRVTFREMTAQEIDEYVASGEPMDKAGAYAIQGGAAKFVVDVDGDYDNVVGLPLESLRASLIRHGWAEP
jgi:septum formation protein